MTLAKQHQRHVGGRFSAAAHTYTEASPLQDHVAKTVIDMVPEGGCPSSVLDAGCGPGRLLMLARGRWPESMLVGVDIAPGMIQKARSFFSGDSRAAFVEGDMATFQGAAGFDLVISSSALHWMRPFAPGLVHLAGQCRVGGLLAAGMMLDGTLGELREAREAVAPHKAAPGRLPTLGDLESVAQSLGGYRVLRIERATEVVEEATGAGVLRVVHETGVTGGDVSQGEAPLTRGEIKALAEWYDRHYSTPGGVRMTFEVGYLLLQRVDG